MGTKRDPSSPLEKSELAKRQNTDLIPQDRVTELKMAGVITEQDLDKIKEDLRHEIASTSKKLGDELRDEIALV